MKGFEDVTLTWQGQHYTVPANRQLMMIAKLEAALAPDDGQAVAVLFRSGGPHHSTLAQAFGAALRYAGADVSDDDIYLTIHEDIAEKSARQVEITIQNMIMALLAIISPPTARKLADSLKEPDPKNP
jgi:hypothetical protein